MKLNKITIDQLRMLGGKNLIDYKGKMIIFDHIAREYLFEEPCRIDAVTILICTSGTLNYVVNLEQINMPENIIQFKSAENLEAYAILISSDMIRSLPYDTLQRASKYLPMEQLLQAPIPIERIRTIKPYFDLLKTCIDKPMQETDEIVKMLLQAFLVTVVGMVREQRSTMVSACRKALTCSTSVSGNCSPSTIRASEPCSSMPRNCASRPNTCRWQSRNTVDVSHSIGSANT